MSQKIFIGLQCLQRQADQVAGRDLDRLIFAAVGKLADITVLSKNIMTVPEAEIPATDVVYTIVGGKVAYRGAAAK